MWKKTPNFHFRIRPAKILKTKSVVLSEMLNLPRRTCTDGLIYKDLHRNKADGVPFEIVTIVLPSL